MSDGDRRRHPRQGCLLKARVETGTGDADVMVTDLSESGAFVATPLGLPLGSALLLRFRRPSDRQWVAMLGLVARCVRPGDGGTVGVGVRFQGLLSAASPSPFEPGAGAATPSGPGSGPATPTPLPAVAASGSTSTPPAVGGVPGPGSSGAFSTRPLRVAGARQPGPGDTFPPRPTQPRANRIFRAIPARFHERGRDGELLPGTIVNLSDGGLYLQADRLPLLGAAVLVEVPGAEVDGIQRPVRLLGQVRWWGSQRPEMGLPRGFGVQVLACASVEEQARYRSFVQRLLKEGGAVPRAGGPG